MQNNYILKLCSDLWSIIGKSMDYNSCNALKVTCKKLRTNFYKHIFSEAHIGRTSVQRYLTIRRRHIGKIKVLKASVSSDCDLFFLRRLDNLKVLDLTDSKVSDKGIRYLHILKIESLCLRGCNNCSVDVVFIMASFHFLKHVDLRFTASRTSVTMPGEDPQLEAHKIIAANVIRNLGGESLFGDNLYVKFTDHAFWNITNDAGIKNLTVQSVNVLNQTMKIFAESVFTNAVVTSDNTW